MSDLLTPDTFASLTASIDDVNSSCTLPPALYVSDEFYRFERESLFSHEWLCVGRTSQIPEAGDYFTRTLVDEPLIVVRDKEGEVRVLSAVCQHRGMVVAEGDGNCSKFTCIYHHWVYGLDGRLLGAPAMEKAVGFEKSQYPLPSLKVEIWKGFIFANFDPDAAPLAPRLRKLEPLVENFDLDNVVMPHTDRLDDLPWNWKVMFENFNDAYHATRLHKGPHDFCPSEMATFFEWDDDDAAVIRLNGFTHIDAGFNATQKALMPIFPGLTDDERQRITFALLPPTLCLGFAPDEVFFFIVEPQSAGSIAIEIGYCFDQQALEHPLFEYLFEQAQAGVKIFNDQDVYADRMVQRGLRSRFAPRGRYSYQEQTLRQFNRWLVSRYARHWPGLTSGERVLSSQNPG
jgi:phenylpropionate dioxygenase-like ring-hydroxylating dioxygenase large terminal subunit